MWSEYELKGDDFHYQFLFVSSKLTRISNVNNEFSYKLNFFRNEFFPPPLAPLVIGLLVMAANVYNVPLDNSAGRK